MEKKKPAIPNPSSSFLPGAEFEGPLGFFWDTQKVPIEALAKAVKEIFDESARRGYSEDLFIEMIKKEIWKPLE